MLNEIIFLTSNFYVLNMIEYLTTNPLQLKYYLLECIECVIVYIYSLRKNIKEKASITLNKLIHLSGNKDLDPFLPIVLESLEDFNNQKNNIEHIYKFKKELNSLKNNNYL